MATLDQQGNVIEDKPLDELPEVTVTGRRVRVAGIDWNGVLTALVAAGLVYMFQQITKPSRRRRR